MANNIEEVVVEVGYEGGERAVFTLSSSGQLSPSNADGVGVDARYWHAATEHLKQFGLRPPDVNCPAHTSLGTTCWPWAEEGQLEGIHELAARYALLDKLGRHIAPAEGVERRQIVERVAGFNARQMACFCQQVASHYPDNTQICAALTALGNRVNNV
jgi:hypothetical protein